MARPPKDLRGFKRVLRRAVLLPLLLMGLMACLSILQLNRLVKTARWLDQTDEVLGSLHEAQRLVVDMQAGERGFLLTRNPALLEPYTVARQALPGKLGSIGRMVADQPIQVELLGRIRVGIEDWNEWSRDLIQAKEEGRDVGPLINTLRGKRIMDGIRAEFNAIIQMEQRLRAERSGAIQRQTQQTLGLILGLGLALGALLAFLTRRQFILLSNTYDQALQAQAAITQQLQKAHDQLEQRVQERTLELLTANRELEAFSYSVSHDLRAPLRGIDGFSQALLEDYGDKLGEEGRNYLQRVRSGTQRMGRLIDDLLNLSRLSRSEMHKKPINLSRLVEQILQEFHKAEPEREIEAKVEPDLWVEGDVGLLSAAIENLLSNAWKFTAKNKKARIEFGRAIDSHGREAFAIRDNGAGFDMAYSDKLFGAFQRLHRADEYSGTGVGLATVRRILRRHGGDIWAESAIGKGAVFYFTVPIVEAVKEAA